MRDFGFARTLRSQIVWKKLRNSKGEQFLAKMQIQANRVYYVGLRTYNGYQYNQKCRTAKLEIISIEKIRAGESTGEKRRSVTHHVYAQSIKKKTMSYKVGQTVSARLSKEMTSCASGIHFYFSKHEALGH